MRGYVGDEVTSRELGGEEKDEEGFPTGGTPHVVPYTGLGVLLLILLFLSLFLFLSGVGEEEKETEEGGRFWILVLPPERLRV